jgi:hypothetical protein
MCVFFSPQISKKDPRTALGEAHRDRMQRAAFPETLLSIAFRITSGRVCPFRFHSKTYPPSR